ncbi:MAG: hypothetical protein H6Q25_847 [Bacteroidetes bacterium]|jgi:hypothetical protein|nr:hypothetical protein [Bacteroidota bacterium]
MKKLIYIFTVLIILGVFLASCTTTAPLAVTSNYVGTKVGVAKTTRFLFFYPDGGDYSIQTAAKNGGITKIATVDIKRTPKFFYILETYETVVTGE